MLTLFGAKQKYCDGLPRRDFLKIGAFTFGAASISLTDILRAEAAAQTSGSHKAIINIFLAGGPPHQDMWDIKTEAPEEIRGEFKAIPTKIPGIQIGEVFPQIAQNMDKFAVIRSIVGASGGHDAIQCTTGWRQRASDPAGHPCIGTALSKVEGPVDPSVPPFVGLTKPTQHRPWADPGMPGFLGSAFGAFRPEGPDLANMTLNGLNQTHLADRRRLRQQFDSLRQDLDVNGSLAGMDAATERALGVLTSSKLLDALDLSKEDPRIRARYGDGKPYKYQYDGAPTANDQLLMARRLVEAGARCVTLSFGRWDSHGKNFDLVRDHGAKLDQALSALIEDLEQRGMLEDVTVIAWGEFGRTPRVNKNAGRDHWPQVSCALLAGGGLKTGQVIGATDRHGGHAVERPVTFGEVFATLYTSLGVDPQTTTIVDPTGRPQHLVDGTAMKELV